MWQEIFAAAAENGIWAVLFCCLLVYQLKDSRRREGKYTQTIEALSGTLCVVKEIKQDTSRLLSAQVKRFKSVKKEEEAKEYEDCGKTCAAG